jgi:hypothetical protein
MNYSFYRKMNKYNIHCWWIYLTFFEQMMINTQTLSHKNQKTRNFLYPYKQPNRYMYSLVISSHAVKFGSVSSGYSVQTSIQRSIRDDHVHVLIKRIGRSFITYKYCYIYTSKTAILDCTWKLEDQAVEAESLNWVTLPKKLNISLSGFPMYSRVKPYAYLSNEQLHQKLKEINQDKANSNSIILIDNNNETI